MNEFAKNVIDTAADEIGTVEHPFGSNNVKYNTEYYGREVSGSGYPWCATFIWWIFKKCGMSKYYLNGLKSAYCPYVHQWGRIWKLIKFTGEPGDIVLFNFSKSFAKETDTAQHIGILEKRISQNTYQTIEGNTGAGNNTNGGAVMRRQRSKNNIVCFIDMQKFYNNLQEKKEMETLKKELAELKEKVRKLEEKNKEYAFVNALPEYYRKEIDEALRLEIGKGRSESELGMTETEVKAAIYALRAYKKMKN